MAEIFRIVLDLRYSTNTKEIEAFQQEYRRQKAKAEAAGEKFTLPDMFWEMWSAYKRINRVGG